MKPVPIKALESVPEIPNVLEDSESKAMTGTQRLQYVLLQISESERRLRERIKSLEGRITELEKS